MKTARLAIAVLAFAAAAASAQTASVSPEIPTPIDLVTLVYQSPSDTCGLQARNSPYMENGTIEVLLLTAPGSCMRAAPKPLRVTLGRFPVGRYEVQVFEEQPSTSGVGEGVIFTLSAFAAFTVDSEPPGQPAPPRDDYSGAWLTDFIGEGVAVSQFGPRLFMTWTTYDDDGQATWYVVPDAVYKPDAIEGPRFEGTLYVAWGARMNNLPFPVFQGVLPLGTGYFYEIGTDDARMDLRFSAAAMPVVRQLKRMRF